MKISFYESLTADKFANISCLVHDFIKQISKKRQYIMGINHEGRTTLEHLKTYANNFNAVTFPNGCFIGFDENEWEGNTPYGTMGLFINDENYQTVLEWLSYWDQSRDENGNIINA